MEKTVLSVLLLTVAVVTAAHVDGYYQSPPAVTDDYYDQLPPAGADGYNQPWPPPPVSPPEVVQPLPVGPSPAAHIEGPSSTLKQICVDNKLDEAKQSLATINVDCNEGDCILLQ